MSTWILDSIGEERIEAARNEVARRLLTDALAHEPTAPEVDDQQLGFLADGLELAVLDAMDDDGRIDEMRQAGADAFQILRVLPRPVDALKAGRHCLRQACLAVLGERGADAARILREQPWPELPLAAEEWGEQAMAAILDAWLRLIRKDGWDDLDTLQARVLDLRQAQQEHEATYLEAQGETARSAAWNLVALYHLAKAAEILAIYTTQGEVDGGFDIRQQLAGQFDRAVTACERAELLELHAMTRLLQRSAAQLVDNCIWTVTRAVNSRVTRFVKNLVSRGHDGHPGRPLFEMLPPQRRALREEGLLGSGRRSVVVNLPTSSGKTLIAEFRILQALNQFDEQRGWIAYLAPTRALVGQVCSRLRQDFAALGIVVERVSPALEIDGLEAALLTEAEQSAQFRVLVTTPEKLDLMLRGDWEEKIGRPLTLVVVDEAHNLAVKNRGIKLELLLATINKECRNAQFLLLTPFIHNAGEIARWLAPDSYQDIELGLAWQPNDRAIALARPVQGAGRGAFSLDLETLHTSKQTLAIPKRLPLGDERPLGLSWSDVKNNAGKLAAATAEGLKARGPVIVLAGKVPHTWSLARNFTEGAERIATDDDIQLVQRFLRAELGPDFLLPELLDYGVGVHHAGLPDEAKTLMEWLLSRERIRVLVATTTIAQGVNFPVSGIVLAAHQYPYGVDMPPEDFWNLAGRAGRVDQGSIGIVALVATSEEKAERLRAFVGKQVSALNSTLIDMVCHVIESGERLELHSLSHHPEWSAFVQYLAHTYRQIGEPERFVNEIERILRGTLGFDALHRDHIGWARQLLGAVQTYGSRLAGKPLKLVDSTGFSWETVSNTLVRLGEARITADVWDPERLFGGDRRPLQKLMGVLLAVPELRENLAAATGGRGPDGDLLAHMVSDWVNGASLPDMAAEYFATSASGKALDPTESLSACCHNLYGKLSQTASWGLAALQTMTFGEDFDRLSEADQQTLRNLPARVFYGVGDDGAVVLRLLGVPRGAANGLARGLGLAERQVPLGRLRAELGRDSGAVWSRSLGAGGNDHYRVWRVLEGVD
ncbi:MAG: DEAD/DEAH box helicase [Chromatiales bacterium]|nr:DEAD/DEAH box helicase [Gammaproteobacteria bacterium]